MKMIALVTMIAIVALLYSDAVPKGSVGGAMTMAIPFLLAAIAAGMHEAWTQKRGVIGWIVSIIAGTVGGILGSVAASFVVDALMSALATSGLVTLEGSLMETKHPLLFITSALMLAGTLLGSWLMLKLVNRMR